MLLLSVTSATALASEAMHSGQMSDVAFTGVCRSDEKARFDFRFSFNDVREPNVLSVQMTSGKLAPGAKFELSPVEVSTTLVPEGHSAIESELGSIWLDYKGTGVLKSESLLIIMHVNKLGVIGPTYFERKKNKFLIEGECDTVSYRQLVSRVVK